MEHERVSLFLRAIDIKAREELLPQLQDMETDSRLSEDWDEVEAVVKWYIKKKRAMAKFMQDWEEDIQEQIHAPYQPAPNAQVNQPTGKEVVPPNTMEEMFKKHNRYSCEIFKEALAKNLVSIKKMMIHDSKTGEKVNINFGWGGMRVFFPDTSLIDENSDLESWSKVIKSLDWGNMYHEILNSASNKIRGVT
ncbi:hypothetical protein KP509_03G013000 [Ceratopteris richardii]|uniref:Uncharacterized protein n=1 Tax=Ceratopteris richardii TaxID=49495 RepID=A0A8T2V132_CERRI|nr:hypothetical protein KP509_03G013000 [Ceratopteris richardii]